MRIQGNAHCQVSKLTRAYEEWEKAPPSDACFGAVYYEQRREFCPRCRFSAFVSLASFSLENGLDAAFVDPLL